MALSIYHHDLFKFPERAHWKHLICICNVEFRGLLPLELESLVIFFLDDEHCQEGNLWLKNGQSIISLREKRPALWSATRCKLTEWGLGTACIGIEYMPESSLNPNDGEEFSLSCFLRHCSCMKVACLTLSGVGHDLSCIFGNPSHKVSAKTRNLPKVPHRQNGQNLS